MSRLTFALVLCLTLPAAAQSVEPKPFDYPWPVQVFDLPESTNGVAYRLYVRPPLREANQGEQPSVIYFLDALNSFTPAAAMSYNYEYFNYIPASYFVGIGYQNEADGLVKEANRTRDYTPTAFEPPDESHYLAGNPVDYEGSGGGAAFWEVVASQIIPFVETQFQVNPNDRVVVGKSMSGLGAVHALLTQPDLFNRFVIISPSIWWDDWFYPRSDRAVGQLERATRELSRTKESRVYLAAGAAEERMGVVTDLYVLQEALKRRQDPNLKVYLDILPGEQHEGVFPAGFMRGIVGVYAGERKESASPVEW